MDVNYSAGDKRLGYINPIFAEGKVGKKREEERAINKKERKRTEGGEEKEKEKRKEINSVFQLLGSKHSKVRVILFSTYCFLFPRGKHEISSKHSMKPHTQPARKKWHGQ